MILFCVYASLLSLSLLFHLCMCFNSLFGQRKTATKIPLNVEESTKWKLITKHGPHEQQRNKSPSTKNYIMNFPVLLPDREFSRWFVCRFAISQRENVLKTPLCLLFCLFVWAPVLLLAHTVDFLYYTRFLPDSLLLLSHTQSFSQPLSALTFVYKLSNSRTHQIITYFFTIFTVHSF